MDKRWVCLKNDGRLAVVIFPTDEEDRHELTNAECRCNVRTAVLDGYTHYKHQAFDHREVDEYYAARGR